MANITFLGLGAMGSRMAKKLIEADHALCVWNRTAAAASSLVASGARQATSPAEAVIDADFVISMLRDDEASKSVWLNPVKGALKQMPKHAIAIESSTLTPHWVEQLATACKDRGIRFSDAPVAGSRPQAEAAQLIYFVGAESATWAEIRPILSIMGGTVHHAGKIGAGAKIKLAVNALFGTQLATIAELLGLLEKCGLEPQAAMDIIGSTPVCSPATKIAANSMLQAKFSPMFPIKLVAKDFSYVQSTANLSHSEVPMSIQTLNILRSAIKQDYGDDNITGIAQLYL